MNYFYDYIGIGMTGLTDFILPFFLVLSVLVFVHELGHYLAARWCGVKVTDFAIGFGKELFGFTDKAGTRWKFCMIPLGGYVQMFGDQDPASAKQSDTVKKDGEDKAKPMTEAERKQAFFSKPVWQRAVIVFAGPAINFLFAIVILIGLYSTLGKPVNPPIAAGVMIDGAADQAGLQPQDRLIMIDGKSIESFSDIQRQVAISLDRPLDVTVMRGESEETITLTPTLEKLEDRFGFSHSRGLIGIMSVDQGIDAPSLKTLNGRDISTLSDDDKIARLERLQGRVVTIGLPASTETGVQNLKIQLEKIEDGRLYLTDSTDREMVHYGILTAGAAAIEETWFIITGTLEAVGQIITGVRSATELGGIVRIGAIAGDAAQNGLIALLTFTALLSINLGLINLFPIPLLDGGHLVFYAYEAVFGKPMPEKVMDYMLKLGMVFLVCLMIFANLNDIVQIML